MKRYIKVLISIGIIVVLVISWISYDVYMNNKIITTFAKDDFSKSLENPVNDILTALEEGDNVDYTGFSDTLTFIDNRYDTSDFRLPSIIRMLYSHQEKLPEEVNQDIKDTVLGFKYWMDQPGDDSMCYWSENHQILFASSEYLLGNYYSDEIFTNMSISGSDHSELGKERVLTWLEQRYLYGFTEWYSSTYYVEDIAPLSVLIDFAPDEEVRIKASMILDLMIYDLATQNYKGVFSANSGRMYQSTKMSGKKSSMKESISVIWPEFKDYLEVDKIGGMEVNFKYIKNYEVPEVLVNIGYDQDDNNIFKASNGLNLSEFKGEDLIGENDSQIMMQLACEAFTNEEVMNNTIKYVDENDMFSNEFLSDFKMINLGIVKSLGLGTLISQLADPIYNGTAIQRANTYMYRTPDYAMSTAQAYHPGTFGDQHSLFSLTMSVDFNIFNQHPAASIKVDGALGSSPNYWVGNGYHPHTVQEENINLSLYVLPDKVNFLGDMVGMARDIEAYSHTYFPSQYFDQVIIDGKYAFGKLDNVYVALIGNSDLYYKTIEMTEFDLKNNLTADYDLIQDGLETFWITEVGTSKDYESFDKFIDNIKSHDVMYSNKTLSYKNLELTFGGEFKIDDEVVDFDYKRFESKYSQTTRKPDNIKFEFGNASLILDFYNLERVVINQN